MPHVEGIFCYKHVNKKIEWTLCFIFLLICFLSAQTIKLEPPLSIGEGQYVGICNRFLPNCVWFLVAIAQYFWIIQPGWWIQGWKTATHLHPRMGTRGKRISSVIYWRVKDPPICFSLQTLTHYDGFMIWVRFVCVLSPSDCDMGSLVSGVPTTRSYWKCNPTIVYVEWICGLVRKYGTRLSNVPRMTLHEIKYLVWVSFSNIHFSICRRTGAQNPNRTINDTFRLRSPCERRVSN